MNQTSFMNQIMHPSSQLLQTSILKNQSHMMNQSALDIHSLNSDLSNVFLRSPSNNRLKSTLEHQQSTMQVQARYNIPTFNNTLLSRNKFNITNTNNQQKAPLQPTVFKLPNGIFTQQVEELYENQNTQGLMTHLVGKP